MQISVAHGIPPPAHGGFHRPLDVGKPLHVPRPLREVIVERPHGNLGGILFRERQHGAVVISVQVREVPARNHRGLSCRRILPQERIDAIRLGFGFISTVQDEEFPVCPPEHVGHSAVELCVFVVDLQLPEARRAGFRFGRTGGGIACARLLRADAGAAGLRGKGDVHRCLLSAPERVPVLPQRFRPRLGKARSLQCAEVAFIVAPCGSVIDHHKGDRILVISARQCPRTECRDGPQPLLSVKAVVFRHGIYLPKAQVPLQGSLFRLPEHFAECPHGAVQPFLIGCNDRNRSARRRNPVRGCGQRVHGIAARRAVGCADENLGFPALLCTHTVQRKRDPPHAERLAQSVEQLSEFRPGVP